jgi:hypothetical protein
MIEREKQKKHREIMAERKKFLATQKETLTEFKPQNYYKTVKGSMYENKTETISKK